MSGGIFMIEAFLCHLGSLKQTLSIKHYLFAPPVCSIGGGSGHPQSRGEKFHYDVADGRYNDMMEQGPPRSAGGEDCVGT